MSRRTILSLVLALAGVILLAVVGAIVFSLLDKDRAILVNEESEAERRRRSSALE